MKTRRWLRFALAAIAAAAIGAWGYYEAMKRAWIRYNEYDQPKTFEARTDLARTFLDRMEGCEAHRRPLL